MSFITVTLSVGGGAAETGGRTAQDPGGATASGGRRAAACTRGTGGHFEQKECPAATVVLAR